MVSSATNVACGCLFASLSLSSRFVRLSVVSWFCTYGDEEQEEEEGVRREEEEEEEEREGLGL